MLKLGNLFMLLLLVSSFCQQIQKQSFQLIKPVKILSFKIDAEQLNTKVQNNRMNISQNLQISSQRLAKCKIIGGISEINLQNNIHLQFYFTYKLFANNSTLFISIFYRPLIKSHVLTQNFVIVLDFLIAQFPPDYFIKIHNITSYQEHVSHTNTNRYDMLFFLNGWNNLTISGNITHSYQLIADIYTIHYMGCESQSKNMGFNQGHDYLLYTFVVVPYHYMKQKFKLVDKIYSLDYLGQFKYFYGIKGTTQQQFVGSFYQRPGGVIFKTQNLGKYKTYGLAYLAYPLTDQLTDLRNHNSNTTIIVIGICAFSIIISFILCYIFRRKIFFKNHLNQDKDYLPDITEQTKNDIKVTDISRVKYDLNTVAEVDERYEYSLKTSYQPKVHEEPTIALKD